MRSARSRTARRSVLLSGLVAAALVVAGCGSSEPTTESADSDFETVTIEHALGTAVITAEPERIVTLGQGSAETAIALGTVPVGIEAYEWGSDETGYLPWIHDAITDRGAQLPVQFTGGSEIDIEAVAKLDPDLILAPWSGVTQQQYDALSALAPTVAYAEKAWTTTWEDQIRVIGKAMGKAPESDQEIAKIKAQFADATAAHPEYADVSFSFVYNTGPGTLGVFFPDEQRVAMVRGLGLQVDPIVNTLPETEGTDSALIGLENAHLLKDSDLLFTFYSDDANRAEIEAQPVYRQIPAIARGSVVAPEDQSFVTGSSMINPLTVPWSLERYVPMIDGAVAQLGN
ncbi:iron-siderophore ABC transporter substrate-binding protein [Prescottella equi]|uniref:iron-siderophore ABC transporter substrate-binding protein n=1 Tax=Rhodococcus hoagii TaxID=43767 RepID=UPI001C765F33|nr:iron-siderophore ABC transporter substrate-binding protein [Prescottella equi]MBM4588699.1 ABC transporter substrate-binding protein [Prescottella equi]MBM4598789.1 ABC transporter substrate-binding protein [Prescottella equi]MBM4692647.1 ABC transporter substrate-binding protein [Prescottella equi]BCN65583.1 iron-siderophore ABC transporter substrate-binding protein [Prescottella equi]BCN75427.1 iron-siderophore ABC transporter substrate-binding protein [Prescottella equi]